eukprot:CAMPEP_0184872808 /NCGR_PEP_ID=MMETSP0580-20130426/41495_1 /TAXON_ID=1118495 /ORGANISM="Dactyliosolen fragilissimus" /LENGTH=330 /DNA_ID=CAMNT_0027375651 /DNA_START=228 /DNA_END=1220 /DNA_ORIENTATION=-
MDILDLHPRFYGAEEVWSDLLRLGKVIMESTNQTLTAMEVGVHSAGQCVLAAKNNFYSHCLEPSPTSFERILKQIRADKEVNENKEIVKKIHLYNVAAGATSGEVLNFTSSGSTGDHVGEFNCYSMKKNEPKKGHTIIKVPSVKLDEMILHNQLQSEGLQVDGLPSKRHNIQPVNNVFVAKIDTQGFEPKVFTGMKESIQTHKIQYILFEYWPKAMDLFFAEKGLDDPNKCTASVEILDMLISAGYKLYALHVAAHPKQVIASGKSSSDLRIKAKTIPLDNFHDHCLFLRETLEEYFPSDDCQMGFWTDFLAVAPGVELYTKRLASLAKK